MNTNVAYETMKKRLAQIYVEQQALDSKVHAAKQSRDDAILGSLIDRFGKDLFTDMILRTDRDDWKEKERVINIDIRSNMAGSVDMKFDCIKNCLTSYSFSGISNSRRGEEAFDADTAKVARYYTLVATLLSGLDETLNILATAHTSFDESVASYKNALNGLYDERYPIEREIKSIEDADRQARIAAFLIEGRSLVEINRYRGDNDFYNVATISKITAKQVKVDFYSVYYKDDNGKVTSYLRDSKNRRISDALWNIFADGDKHGRSDFKPVKNSKEQLLALEPIEYDYDNFDLFGIDIDKFKAQLAKNQAK